MATITVYLIAIISSIEAFPLHEGIRRGIDDVDVLSAMMKENDVNSRNVRNETPLHVAVMSGNYAACHILVEAEADLEAKDGFSCTPLMRAVKSNRLEMAKLFINKGSDVNTCDAKGDSPLIVAAMNGFVEVFKALFFHPLIKIYKRGNGEATALMHAAAGGHLEIIRHFIFSDLSGKLFVDNMHQSDLHKAVINGHTAAAFLLGCDRFNDFYWQDVTGANVIHYAAMYGRLKILLNLLMARDDGEVNCLDAFGNTPLICALHPVRDGDVGGDKSTPAEIVRALLLIGADVTVRNHLGQSLEEVAEFQGQNEALSVIRKAIMVNSSRGEAEKALPPLIYEITNEKPSARRINFILRRNIRDEVNAQDHLGRTALHLAVSEGLRKIVRDLLSNGANVTLQDGVGNTPLHMIDDADIARELLNSNPKAADIADLRGFLPLHNAARFENEELIDVLAQATSNVNACDGGRTPLEIAAIYGNKKNTDVLLKRGASLEQTRNTYSSPGALYCSLIGNKKHMMEYFMEKGADAMVSIHGGHTVSHAAAIAGFLPCLRLLIHTGKVPVKIVSDYGISLLHCAVSKSDNDDVMKFLLDSGVDLEAKTRWGKTPLYFASKRGHHNHVRLLLEAGADPYAATYLKKTALHVAAKFRHAKVVKLLVDKDVNLLKTKNYKGKTPADKLFRRTGIWSLQPAVTRKIMLNVKITAEYIREKNLWKAIRIISPSFANYLMGVENVAPFPEYLQKGLEHFMRYNGNKENPRDLFKAYNVYGVDVFYSIAAAYYPLLADFGGNSREAHRRMVLDFETSRHKRFYANEIKFAAVEAFMKNRKKFEGTYMNFVPQELVEDILINYANNGGVLERIECYANSLMLALEKKEEFYSYGKYFRNYIKLLKKHILKKV